MKQKILLNYQTNNLRYAVEELKDDYTLYSWRSTALEFTKRHLPKLPEGIKDNIDIDAPARYDMAEIVRGYMDLNGIKYIFPLYNDMLLPHLHKELGIAQASGKYLANKETYSDLAHQLGILVPEKYTSFEIEYPAIGKPVNGTGGLGIKVLMDEQELFDFESGKDVNYNTLGAYYLFQKFIPGPIVSVAGRIVDGEIFFDIIYDIEMCDLPYRAETGFTWPSKHIGPKVEETIKENLEKFIRAIPELDNQPFMADFVMGYEGPYLIDFSARMSVSAQTLIKYSAGCQYNRQVVESQLNKDKTVVTCKKPVVYRFFNYKKGNYTFTHNDTGLYEEMQMPESTQYMRRLDMLVSLSGYAVTTGETFAEADQKWREVAESIHASSV